MLLPVALRQHWTVKRLAASGAVQGWRPFGTASAPCPSRGKEVPIVRSRKINIGNNSPSEVSHVCVASLMGENSNTPGPRLCSHSHSTKALWETPDRSVRVYYQKKKKWLFSHIKENYQQA
ncbi:hypothetical protein DV515_00007272, partial [Chloebia gouldiae]